MKLFFNSRIYTLEKPDEVFEAILIYKNRILGLGDRKELRDFARDFSRRTQQSLQEIDLEGGCVLPGFIDAHTHFLHFALNLENINLKGNESLDEVLQTVEKMARSKEPGEWITGGGWDKNIWETMPEKSMLDKVAPSNPVALYSKDVHTLWANSLAIKEAGINKDTPDPEGGKIERNESGEPSGIFRENASSLIMDSVPEPSMDEKVKALKNGFNYAYQKGVTGVHTSEGKEAWSVYQYLQNRNESGLRILMMIPHSSLDSAIELGLRSGLGNNFLRIGPLKLFVDGALGSQTAALYEPYCGSTNSGMLILPEEKLSRIVLKAAKNGISSAIHAIGDLANHVAVTALKKASKWQEKYDLRQRIEHVQLIKIEDIEEMQKNKIIASMQPIHIPGDIPKIRKYWGERKSYAYPLNSLLKKGIPLAFGSDVPVEDIDPLKGIQAAITRSTEDGKDILYPEEIISTFAAVRAFTLGSAYAAGEEKEKGTLKTGKLADMVVLNKDIFETEPEEIIDIDVKMTVLNGEIVFQK